MGGLPEQLKESIMQVLMPAQWVIHGEAGSRSLGFWDGERFGPLGAAQRYDKAPCAETAERAGEAAWNARREGEGSSGVTHLLFVE